MDTAEAKQFGLVDAKGNGRGAVQPGLGRQGRRGVHRRKERHPSSGGHRHSQAAPVFLMAVQGCVYHAVVVMIDIPESVVDEPVQVVRAEAAVYAAL